MKIIKPLLVAISLIVITVANNNFNNLEFVNEIDINTLEKQAFAFTEGGGCSSSTTVSDGPCGTLNQNNFWCQPWDTDPGSCIFGNIIIDDPCVGTIEDTVLQYCPW